MFVTKINDNKKYRLLTSYQMIKFGSCLNFSYLSINLYAIHRIDETLSNLSNLYCFSSYLD